jgi:type VI secretion system protein ImpG
VDDELLAYYEGELRFLRESGAEFARRYPKVAARLQLDPHGTYDPHVERLLEGCALLTARVRKKLDDEYPEITEGLLEVLYPHLLRPTPPMTIVQFLPGPDPSAMAGGHQVSTGTSLISPPIDRSPVRFRTAYPVTLWPIEVAEARLLSGRVDDPARPPGATGLLRLTLRGMGGQPVPDRIDRLRFFLDGDTALALGIYELLHACVIKVVARLRNASGAAIDLPLAEDAIRPVGFEPDEGLVPYSRRSFPGYRLLQEFFAFPAKFHFVDVIGLDRLKGRGGASTLELLLFLDRVPGGLSEVDPEHFKLGCTPAVNLFTLTAEPITLDQAHHEYRLIPDVHRQGTTEVYSVDSVRLAASYLEEAVPIPPFHEARDPDPEAAWRRTSWYAVRRPSPRRGDSGTEVSLVFVQPDFEPSRAKEGVVTAEVTCTNRDLADRLPFGGDRGDLQMEAPGPIGRIRCLRKPTPTRRPRLGGDLHWRLISMLSLNHLSLAGSADGLEALRSVLTLHDPADSAVSRQQIAGISKISSRRVAGRVPGGGPGGAVCLGQEIAVEFDESHFVGSGSLLLAAVLERFLGSYATINSFTRLVARTRQREGILKRWPPRAGDRTLL